MVPQIHPPYVHYHTRDIIGNYSIISNVENSNIYRKVPKLVVRPQTLNLQTQTRRQKSYYYPQNQHTHTLSNPSPVHITPLEPRQKIVM